MFKDLINGFTKIDYALIVIFGIISGVVGVYLTVEFSAERYAELGLLFPVWLILQTPVHIAGLVFKISAVLINPLTFVWWFFLGGSFGFMIVTLRSYFDSVYIE